MTRTNLILYTDGSFKNKKAGWGIHGYFYTNEPMKSKANLKQQPTATGYSDVPVEQTCSVVKYVDSFGRVQNSQTNNTAELTAVIKAIELGIKESVEKLTIILDSDYVRLGLTENIDKWIKANWRKSDGNPVKNKGLWVKLKELKDIAVKTMDFELVKVKGHSNDLGNDKADTNALRGTQCVEDIYLETDSIEINKVKKIDINPLILESRLIFSTKNDTSEYYYTYNLDTYHNAGGKPKDTAKEKLARADMLIGRRLAEATYSVFKAKEPEDYLDTIKQIHIDTLGKAQPELAIINLSNACNAKQRQQIESLGIHGLLVHEDIEVISTPDMALISRTLNPPRLAFDAIGLFNNLETQLNEYLNDSLGKNVKTIDITNLLYSEETKNANIVFKLLKNITNDIRFLEIPFELEGKEYKIKLLLGYDIPARNQLNKISKNLEKVTLLIFKTGPLSYSYSTVFKTTDGDAIYSSPYVQFLTR